MGNAAGDLADRLELLDLAQGLLGLAQARLLANPVADVVDETIGADPLAFGVALVLALAVSALLLVILFKFLRAVLRRVSSLFSASAKEA